MSPSVTSVVIDNFDVVGISVLKAKADAPLVVDPDAIRTTSIALQSFKLISRRRIQGIERTSSVELQQSAPSGSFEINESPNKISSKKPLGILASEAPNHLL